MKNFYECFTNEEEIKAELLRKNETNWDAHPNNSYIICASLPGEYIFAVKLFHHNRNEVRFCLAKRRDKMIENLSNLHVNLNYFMKFNEGINFIPERYKEKYTSTSGALINPNFSKGKETGDYMVGFISLNEMAIWFADVFNVQPLEIKRLHPINFLQAKAKQKSITDQGKLFNQIKITEITALGGQEETKEEIKKQEENHQFPK